MDLNEELKFCENSKKKFFFGGGGVGGVGGGEGEGSGGCERRIQGFVKIQKKKWGGGRWGVGGRGRVGGSEWM